MVNMPQRGELHAVKILNDSNSIYNFLIANNNNFFQGENFQKRYIHEFPKLLWRTEKLEDLGDFVMLFPNPSTVDPSQLRAGLSNIEAADYFTAIFESSHTYPYKRKFMSALRQAYNQAFIELDLTDKDDSSKMSPADHKHRKEDARKETAIDGEGIL